MQVKYVISNADVKKVKTVVEQHRDDDFVRRRIRRNIKKDREALTPNRCWQAHMMCLLTTQQKSGPNSAVSRLLRSRPFPLKFSNLKKSANHSAAVLRELRRFGGIRRTETIAKQASANMVWFSGAGWRVLKRQLSLLEDRTTAKKEREVADWLAANFKGLGPKQSRNFVQSLGLSRYEIPIDSRISRWLRDDFGFPLPTGPAALADTAYYCLLSDIIQDLANRADVYPCVLDAVLFARVDQGQWQGVVMEI